MTERFRNNRKGFSVVEYIALISITLLALYVLRWYIINGLSGKWKAGGDSFGVGRQYDPLTTTDCAFDPRKNQWYDVTCFDAYHCNSGDTACTAKAVKNCTTLICNRAEDEN